VVVGIDSSQGNQPLGETKQDNSTLNQGVNLVKPDNGFLENKR
jgi:hypothetical protein